ncbi:ATP-binding protein [Breoghania sp. L-A4]|uniref:ATP-binding protein n=1 Tax=Breoghania sp. L-A4 TaxID=2304600 RepID=UPI000E35B654|nr:ATP-binding protein [Breoghania sp. L-A4]AXS39779.1 ATP-binding protein [Breoghania sp. L-A4]
MSAATRRQSGLADMEKLRAALRGKAEVLAPGDAEEPILHPAVRAAIYEWLTEINAAGELSAVGVKPRTTALLSGPPGCGKTTLAHHLSARLGVPMVNVGPETLYDAHLGASERNMADLFDVLATTKGRCIVFLDEIDAVGTKRAADSGGGAQNARNSMLTVLLRRIESFAGILIAATNRPDTLDPALWRRFGMQIDVALPDEDARYAILKRYGMPFLFDEAALDLLAAVSEGAAPSLLRQLMEGAKRQIVIGGRMRRMPATAAEAFRLVVAQTRPHPDYEPPPLWRDTDVLAALQPTPWPPEVANKAED